MASVVKVVQLLRLTCMRTRTRVLLMNSMLLVYSVCFMVLCWFYLSGATEHGTAVGEAAFSAAAEHALSAAKPTWETVDTSCVLHVDALDEGAPAKVRLSWPNGTRSDIVAPSALMTAEFRNTVGAALCQVAFEADSQAVVMPILSYVDSLDYLLRDHIWTAFLNKVAYCQRTQRRLFLFVGRFPRELVDSRAGALPWQPCEEPPGNGNNVPKTIAILSLMHLTPPPPAVFYMDADAWFSDAAYTSQASPEAYLDVGGTSDLVGASNHYAYSPIVLNGGLLLFRNTAWARSFLSLWWQARCGKKDQLPLQHVLLSSWSAETSGRFTFSPQKLANYEGTGGSQYAREHVRASAGSVWQQASAYEYGGHLVKPLSLPHVLVLPVAPVQSLVPLPAFRSDLLGTGLPWTCHRGKMDDPQKRFSTISATELISYATTSRFRVLFAPRCLFRDVCSGYKCKLQNGTLPA